MGQIRFGRAGVAAAGAGALAVATSRDPTWFLPWPGLLVAGALVLAGAFFVPRRWRAAACVMAALLAGGLAGRVLLAPGMPRVHDLMHLWGIWSVGRALHEGALLPRWIPYLGAGMPLLQFYGPANFALALPGIVLGLSPVGAWKLELLAGHLLSAVSMLGAARWLGAGWRASLVAAVAGAFAPYRLTVFDYRGALAEANAFLWMPWIAAGTLRVLRSPAPQTALILGLAVAGLVLTHLVMLPVLALALLPVLIVSELQTRPGAAARRWGWLAGTLVAALGLTACWWIPAVGEAGHTSVREFTEQNRYYRYEHNGVPPQDLLVRRGWDRMRVALPGPEREQRGLEGEQMPFYAGTVLLVMGLTAAWWSRRREAWALATGAALALLLSTTWLADLGALGPLATVRFPFRFLGPASILLGLALALGIDARRSSGERWTDCVPAAVLVALLAWDGAPYTGAADRIPPYRGTVHWYTAEPDWVHWERSMQPAAVRIEPVQGVARVRDLQLPPADYDERIDAFYPAYYEWLTPEIYRRYWRAETPAGIAPAGVGYGFVNSRREARRWPARPYATLEVDGFPPVTTGTVDRRPGRIAVETEVPESGGRLVVLEQAFPGWRARIDGGAWHATENAAGFLQVPLAGGRHRVELRYGSATLPRRAGWAVSAATLLLLGLLGARLRR